MGAKLIRRILFGAAAVVMFVIAASDLRAGGEISQAALPGVVGVISAFMAITAKGG